MRSTKSRNRSKSNRNNRSMGNVINRVFDSSGPEGKVRGTPQQIIDKYTQLARDAQLSGDRVAFENFQQHSEHYQRLLAEAQKEQDARREQQERENKERQAQRDAERAERAEQRAAAAEAEVGDESALDVAGADPMAVIDTPEAAAEEKPKAKPRRRRAPKPKEADVASDDAPQPEVTADAAE
ncbi:MAG: DUF4167 domain-containing protein [Planktomarina sp.]